MGRGSTLAQELGSKLVLVQAQGSKLVLGRARGSKQELARGSTLARELGSTEVLEQECKRVGSKPNAFCERSQLRLEVQQRCRQRRAGQLPGSYESSNSHQNGGMG
ncbi:hypothetical protein CA85_13320 [Allorhodopirellula solitaria]|uniref:Uncharacterized protein n=1 Tax=Allorhodopirellula solitaria TaxID=2527987 RepID=A0A5C5YEG4_9BACT|nr:hypothetical protein CA85_13320 [Allorhodopirellula solitaria]